MQREANEMAIPLHGKSTPTAPSPAAASPLRPQPPARRPFLRRRVAGRRRPPPLPPHRLAVGEERERDEDEKE